MGESPFSEVEAHGHLRVSGWAQSVPCTRVGVGRWWFGLCRLGTLEPWADLSHPCSGADAPSPALRGYLQAHFFPDAVLGRDEGARPQRV